MASDFDPVTPPAETPHSRLLARVRLQALAALCGGVGLTLSSCEPRPMGFPPATAGEVARATEPGSEPPPMSTIAPPGGTLPPTRVEEPPPPPPPLPPPPPSFPSCPSESVCAARPSHVSSPAPGFGYCEATIDHPDPTRRAIYGGPGYFDGTRTADERKRVDVCCYNFVRPCPGGRPCVIDGKPIHASVELGNTWNYSFSPVNMPRSGNKISNKPDLWAVEALGEHASIAAFSRIALELLRFGAPLQLVRSVHLAAIEEVDHARQAFSLAGAVHPGPVDVAQAIPHRTLTEFAVETLRDGCLGELTAALVAACAAERAIGAERDTLLRIAEDESQHAVLSFAILHFALKSGGESVRQGIRQALLTLQPMAFAGYGVLSAKEVSELGREVIETVLRPILATSSKEASYLR